MTHYQNRKEHFDGNVVMFTRSDATRPQARPIWQARFKILGQKGYKTQSLKTPNYEDAYVTAKSLYLSYCQKSVSGEALSEYSFDKAWDNWIIYGQGAKIWAESRYKWHKSYGNRYFKPYFGKTKLNSITPEFVDTYWSWRRNYWSSPEGEARILKNPTRRRLGNSGTGNAKKAPSVKTLEMEKVALNQFFRWAHEKRRIMHRRVTVELPGISHQSNEGRRPTFERMEWRYLALSLESWTKCIGKFKSDKVNDYHKHYRQQLRYYVLFLSGTGIRPGTETRYMRWEDISYFQDLDGQEKASIRIRQNTKKRVQRIVISMPEVAKILHEWHGISRYNKQQDLVWYGQSALGEPQNLSTDMNKTFQTFLKRVQYQDRTDGLLFDGDGRKRALYSIRHYYATQRLLNGVQYSILAKNMGTSIQQLQRHYDWVETKQKSVELTVGSELTYALTVAQSSAMAGVTVEEFKEILAVIRARQA